jgi:hypothetical protein
MLFCENFRNVFRLRKRNLADKYTYTIASSFDQLDLITWDYVNGERNLFLSSNFLRTLHNGITEGYQYRYVIVFEEKIPLAIAFLQVINFSADLLGDLVVKQLNVLKSRRANFFSRYVSANKDLVIFRLLTLGNNFISGDHGITFVKEVAIEEKFSIINFIVKEVASQEKLRGRISAILIKDFFDKPDPHENKLVQNKFLEFAVEPNMVVKIPEQVKTLPEYISLFSKKYRKRTRDIFKSFEGAVCKELNSDEIEMWNSTLYSLYLQVYERAKFKLVRLHPNYFSDVKKSFREKFVVRGVFYEDKLIGFQSAFVLDDYQLEAHFIGIDYEYNSRFELYQNILFGFIQLTIQYGKQELNLGRTATEIKSTVGAKPVNLFCYVKPQNSVSRLILQPFISFLQPGQWTPRNPFR